MTIFRNFYTYTLFSTFLFLSVVGAPAHVFAARTEIICIAQVKCLGTWSADDQVEVLLTNLTEGADPVVIAAGEQGGTYVLNLKPDYLYEIVAKGRTSTGEYSIDTKEIDLYGKKPGEVVRVGLSLLGAPQPGLRNEIPFVRNSTQFLEAAYPSLNHLLSFLLDYPNTTFRIECYADANEANPQQLAENRGRKISAWLVERGVEKERLFVRAYGSHQQPLLAQETEPVIPAPLANVRVLYTNAPAWKAHARVNYVLSVKDTFNDALLEKPEEVKVSIYRLNSKTKVLISDDYRTFYKGMHIFDLCADFKYEVQIEAGAHSEKFILDLTEEAQETVAQERVVASSVQN